MPRMSKAILLKFCTQSSILLLFSFLKQNNRLGVSLAKYKDTILRERDRLNSEVDELKRRLQMQRIYADEMEKKRMESENKNKNLYKLLDVHFFFLIHFFLFQSKFITKILIQESSSEAFKDRRQFEQLKVDFDELTKSKMDVKDELAHYKGRVRIELDLYINENILKLYICANTPQ